MSEVKSFPFLAWVIKDDYRVVQIELVEGVSGDESRTKRGTWYRNEDLFSARQDAVNCGLKKLKNQELCIEQQQANIERKKKTLQCVAVECKKSAAPDLLAALKQLRTWQAGKKRLTAEDVALLEVADKAIKKATGETP